MKIAITAGGSVTADFTLKEGNRRPNQQMRSEVCLITNRSIPTTNFIPLRMRGRRSGTNLHHVPRSGLPSE